ncbi:phosphatidylinositol N-acetylglucosaminyltransferase-domain-containing protein [Endogone sp. FLAS-F59071]|nr:phosphatidylinositol N-acetylglucosaminyltransferase-domain-containing protein [Endogone sp. FLAS-F59071]|eukprot:RUS22824.1 phosphatidylinositol N-acetylglucosaminyltransferase-domain-containing protein [Endogone sp. FLAS-F59071]
MTYTYCPNDGRKFLDDETTCPVCGLERKKNWLPPLEQPEFPTKPTWRKLMYVKQDYPDNYVDSTFLDELQKNVNVRTYDYWTVVYESGVISQHISTIAIFIAVFIYLYTGVLPARSLIWIGSVLTSAAYIFWDWSIIQTEPSYRYKRKKIAKGALLFYLTLLGLSPILKTLTKDTSSDTIWALTVCLFLANMLFHDYGSNNRTNIKFPGSLSTNAAIFASVLLASRLDTNSHVFGLMSFAVEWFALFPIFRRYLKVRSVNRSLTFKGNVTLTILLFLLATALFIPISKAVTILNILGSAFITFCCPYWLIWIQRYKNEIHGPWDEALPKLQDMRSLVDDWLQSLLVRERLITESSE